MLYTRQRESPAKEQGGRKALAQSGSTNRFGFRSVILGEAEKTLYTSKILNPVVLKPSLVLELCSNEILQKNSRQAFSSLSHSVPSF